MKKQELSCLVKVRCSATNKKGMAKTSVQLSIGSESTECYIGYIMPKHHWDEAAKKCSEDHPDHKSINQQIDDVLAELNAYFLVLSRTKGSVSVHQVKEAYQNKQSALPGVDQNESELIVDKTLLMVADLFIKDFEELTVKGKRSFETLKQWRATRKKIEEFARYQYRRKDIVLSEITPAFGQNLYRYLTIKRQDFLKHEKNKRRSGNLEEAAARKQMKNIKQLLQLATDLGYIGNNPISRFKTSCEEEEVEPLEMFEVMAIYRKDISIERLAEVRDMYIFQCFTGFAYTDLYNLTPKHIVPVGLNGEPWLIKRRGKTGVREMVPLLPVALAIIEKYRNHPYCQASGRLLPVNSNVVYNAFLKEIAVICDVNRVLKTHLARHTFADIMLNECNVPIEDVSKMLGHKNIRTTMRYCRVRKKRISANMKVAKEMLFDDKGNLHVA